MPRGNSVLYPVCRAESGCSNDQVEIGCAYSVSRADRGDKLLFPTRENQACCKLCSRLNLTTTLIHSVNSRRTFLSLKAIITPPPVSIQVDDPSRVFVLVALGFHVEFTLPEAVSFADVKRSSLAKTVAKLGDREAEVARDIVSAESMIRDLRALV